MMWYIAVALLVAPALGARLPSARMSFTNGRIYGGSQANAGQFPYQAALDRNNGHWCGGSVISNNYVLTAAHCITNPINQYRVYLGQHNRNNRDNNVQSPAIFSFLTHPSYTGSNTGGFEADVALIQTQVFSLNNRVQTIELAPNNANYDGQICTISGWGRTESGNPSTLQFVGTRAISRNDCANRLEDQFNTVVGNFHICFLSDNLRAGSCGGDSGGPAVCNDGRLAGVTSWGISNVFGNCFTEYPSVYASVSFYRNWIIANAGL